MDPITLALAGLNMAGAGYNYYNNNRLQHSENQFGNAQGAAEVAAAQNAQAQFEADFARRRRQMQESLAARGVEDSTIAGDEMNYLNQGAERQRQNLSNQANLAQRHLALIHQQARSRRRGNYLNLGLGLANSLGGAYASMASAPAAAGAGNVGADLSYFHT